MSAMVNRSTSVQIMPSVSLRLPSMISAHCLNEYQNNSETIICTFRADIRQLDASACNKLEGFDNVFRLLHTHSRGFVISTERDVPYLKNDRLDYEWQPGEY
jgi:hypothetical protein